MQGIIVVDKPQGFTSFDVIAKLRGILKTKKIGHSGTLDPMATGVLPVFVGQAAKAVDMQTNHNKEYHAVIRFGIKTDTGDITGNVLEKREINITEEGFIKALKGFEGTYMQLPPMYSAVKINGQPLYKLARRGETIERTPRSVTIYSTEFIGQTAENEFAFSAMCSKGTYIRTLCEDIGAALCAPATLAQLRRTIAGEYSLKNAYTLDQIQKAKDEGRAEELLISVDTVFADLPKLTVTEREKRCLLNGLVYTADIKSGRFCAYYENDFLGVAESIDGQVKVIKMFCERE